MLLAIKGTLLNPFSYAYKHIGFAHLSDSRATGMLSFGTTTRKVIEVESLEPVLEDQGMGPMAT